MGNLLTSAAVCKELGVCRKTLERWVKEGTFPEPFKLSARKLVWDRVDVMEFIKQKRA